MKDYVIVADSTSDLPKSAAERLQIRVVPLRVLIGEREYEDGVDCSAKLIFDLVQRDGIMPKTSAATPSDIEECFKSILRTGKKVLFIGISSELSSTVQNALAVAQTFPEGDVEIVDSRNVSTGIGLLVMKAVDFALEGKPLRETAATLRILANRVRTEFVIDTLDYLYKGGRMSGMQHLIGSMLKIKPLITLEDGIIKLVEKLRGSQRKAVDAMLERMLANKDRIDRTRVFVAHAAAGEMAAYLKERIEKELDVREVVFAEAGSVISSHCGPGAVGIMYLPM